MWARGAFMFLGICHTSVALQNDLSLSLEDLCFMLSVLCFPHKEWVLVSALSSCN